ncbi:hypothetical protein GQ457_02G030140 [Hibiscus cannabinus]
MAPPEVPVVHVEEDQTIDSQVFTNKRVNICLTESNFLLWKQQIVLTIRGLGLEGYLDGSTKAPAQIVKNRAGEDVLNPNYLQFLKQDSSLASWLLSTISPNILPKLVGAETTASIWEAVTKSYSSLSTTKVMNLHCRLRSMKKGSQSMHEYIMAIKHTCDLLAACRSPISDVEHIATILNGLPIEYEPSIAAITASKESYTVDNIVSILIDAETRMEDTSSFPIGVNYTRAVTTANNEEAGNTDFNNTRSVATNSSRFKGRPRPQCQLCGKLGHLVDRCWHRFDQNFKGVASQQIHSRSSTKAQVNACSCCSHSTTEVAYSPFVNSSTNDVVQDDNPEMDVQVNSLMVEDGSTAYSKWFPDSGATHHVTTSANSLHNKAPYAGKGKVHLGDGTSLDINHIGTSIINSDSRLLYLDQVLYVPQIKKNLLSVAKFAKDNVVFFEFHAQHCYVKDSNTKEVLLQGRLDGGLYSFSCCSNEESSTLSDDARLFLSKSVPVMQASSPAQANSSSNPCSSTSVSQTLDDSNSADPSHEAVIPDVAHEAREESFNHAVQDHSDVQDHSESEGNINTKHYSGSTEGHQVACYQPEMDLINEVNPGNNDDPADDQPVNHGVAEGQLSLAASASRKDTQSKKVTKHVENVHPMITRRKDGGRCQLLKILKYFQMKKSMVNVKHKQDSQWRS